MPHTILETIQTCKRWDEVLDRAAQIRTGGGPHLWILTTAHTVTGDILDAVDADQVDQPMLPGQYEGDAVGPIFATIICYVCEAGYTPEARGDACPGHPQ